jgi:uncharacterized membrane protein YqjE
MSASDSGARPVGLLNSLRRLSSTLVEILRTRIELVVTELEEEKVRALQIAALSFVVLLFGSLAVIFGTLAVVMAYWDRNPVAVLGAFAAFYLVLAIVAGFAWRARIKARPRLLSATLAELARDREELTPR